MTYNEVQGICKSITSNKRSSFRLSSLNASFRKSSYTCENGPCPVIESRDTQVARQLRVLKSSLSLINQNNCIGYQLISVMVTTCP